jgi:predicted dehydrogenase
VKVAVLGCGSIGRRHLRNLAAMQDVELLAYDPSRVALHQASAEARCRPVAHVTDLWRERPDAIVVAAPPAEHLRLIAAGLEAGCHVFVEKPLTHSLDGLDAILARSHEAGVTTMVGCNMRYHPGPAAIRQLVNDHTIGQVLTARLHTGSFLPQWRPETDFRTSYTSDPTQGGALLDCIHEVDLALWYFGKARVIGAAVQPARHLGISVEGIAEILVRHETGVLSSVHLNLVQRDYRRTCVVIGTEGTLYWDLEQPLILIRRADSPARVLPLNDHALNDMYVDELRDFLTCIRAGLPSPCPLEQGADAVRLVLCARALAAGSQREEA